MEERSARRAPPGAATVAALAALLYAVTLGFGFLSYDDPHFVLEPEVVRAPSARTVTFVLAHPVWGSYHPLHQLSYALDAALFGLENPQAFHATNVLLYALAAALVVRVARSLGLSSRAATLAGVLWTVHPSHVESVAWVTGRKDVLSGVLALACLAVALRSRPSRGDRVLALLLFALALAAKTTAAFVAPLLLVHAWLERRLDRRELVRLLPFLVLAAAWIVVDGLAQKELGAVRPLRGGSALEQLRLATWCLAWYPVRFLWPHPLTPRPSLEPSPSWGAGDLVALAILGACAVAALASVRRRPRVALFVAWFFLALAPVSNLVPMPTSVQDRYLFFPSIAGACLVAELAVRARPRGLVLGVVAVATFLFAHATARSTRAWHDDVALWEAAVRAEPANPIARVGLSGALHGAGDLDGAAREAALAVDSSGGAFAWEACATVALARERNDEAIHALEEAWRSPDATDATGARLVHVLLANAREERAARILDDLARRSPGSAGHLRAAAYLLQARGALKAARVAFEAARRKEPLSGADELALAQVERLLGDVDAARAALERAEARGALPQHVAIERGELMLLRQDPREAAASFARAVALEPRSVRARMLLAEAHARCGRYDAAVRVLESVDDPEARAALARIRR